MVQNTKRVYCAGPLFNDKERLEMQEIAAALERAGFETFLPQRDGLELSACIQVLTSRGFAEPEAAEMVSRAIFALDAYQVISGCDAIFVNLNGRVPDEGAVSEAALAWCSGKHVVGYKGDSRSLLSGQDNPLVSGLFDFIVYDRADDAVKSLRAAFGEHPSRKHKAAHRNDQIKAHLDLGREIWEAMHAEDRLAGITSVLLARREQAGLKPAANV